MEDILKTLPAFIKDFDLVQNNGSICFDATIYYSIKTDKNQLHTEINNVQVVIKKMDTIYMLHPDLALYRIPDIFTEGKEQFIYLPNQAFVIMGEFSDNESYVLSIHPGHKKCDLEEIIRLHARMHSK